MTITNDLNQLNDAGTSGDWTTSGFDSPQLNNSSSTIPYYIEGATCQEWPLKKGTTDGYTYDDIGNVDFTGFVFVAHYYIPAPDVTNIPLTEFWVQLSSDAGFTTNYGRWDALPTFAASPGSFVPIPVYLTNADETAGTLVVNSVSSMGFTATTGDNADGKAGALDHFYIVSEFGGHSETWSGTFFDDLIDDATSGSDAEVATGVLTRSGDFFDSRISFSMGDGAADTANTDITETDKTVYFNNVQPEQELGYIGNNPSGANELRLSLTRVVHFWNSQSSTSDIISNPANFDQLKIDACSFSNGGRLQLRSWISDALTFMTNSTITSCHRVEPNTMLFENNTVQDTAVTAVDSGAILINSSSHRVSDSIVSKGTAASHAIVITSTGSYSLSNMTFNGYNSVSGNNDSTIRNESGGAVTINASNITGNLSYQNGTGASTTILNAVTVRVEGVTEAAAVKVVAGETAGTITEGDTILEKLADSNGVAERTDFNYEGAFNPSGLDVIVRARASGLPAAAIQDDNGSYTDQTTNANSSSVNDMNLLPTVPVVNQDRYIFGHPEQFGQLKLELSTVGTGGFTITWQYWNGAWTSLSGVVDGTSNFTLTGPNKVSWTIPGDWATTTINSQGSYYYVRAAYTAGTVSIVPLGRKCALDVNRYIPFVQNRIIESVGLTVNASWVRDDIATF